MVRAPSTQIALMEDWEEKIERIAQSTLNKRITHLAGVPTWTLVLIKRLFEITGKSDLSEIWPHLELYIHGGVNFTPYREQFKGLISSNKMNYLESYNASEGFLGIKGNPEDEDMLLTLDHGIFYEFQTLEQATSGSNQAIGIEDAELNTNYALIINTNSGLWRYRIGDTVKFTSLDPYKIQVTGRVKHFINAFGEEVIIDNSDTAITYACDQTGAMVREYTVAPIYLTESTKGAHEWLIEFEQEPDDMRKFIKLLDQKIQDINSDYEAKRYKDIALDLPKVHIVRSGIFHEWLKSKGKLGGQHKVPRLSNDRDHVEEILALMSN